MVLFWLPAGICLEAVANRPSPIFEGENEGLVFGQQAFAFTVSTCLGNIKNFVVMTINSSRYNIILICISLSGAAPQGSLK